MSQSTETREIGGLTFPISDSFCPNWTFPKVIKCLFRNGSEIGGDHANCPGLRTVRIYKYIAHRKAEKHGASLVTSEAINCDMLKWVSAIHAARTYLGTQL